MDLEKLKADVSRLLEEMTATSLEVGAHTPIEPLGDLPHERLELPGEPIPQDMVEMSAAMSAGVEVTDWSDSIRRTFSTANAPPSRSDELRARAENREKNRELLRDFRRDRYQRREESRARRDWGGMDLNDAQPAMAFDAGAVPGDERNEGQFFPEHDTVRELEGIGIAMRDYHRRLIQTLNSMRRVLLEGIGDLDRINGLLHRP